MGELAWPRAKVQFSDSNPDPDTSWHQVTQFPHLSDGWSECLSHSVVLRPKANTGSEMLSTLGNISVGISRVKKVDFGLFSERI